MPSAIAPETLSAEAFRQRVLALDPRVAVFDCDGTLWSGDAGSSFMRWTMDNGLLSTDSTAWLTGRYAAYKNGDVSELAICGEMVQVYRGLPVDTLRAAAAAFFSEEIERHIFPEMLDLVAELQRRGAEIWAVSSTADWVIEEGVRRFNIPTGHVLAACVHCSDGVATDNLRDVPTDEGKVASLRRAGITQPDAVFGNSVHDAAMLSIARNGGAFPVNPSPQLIERASQQGWPIFIPALVAPTP